MDITNIKIGGDCTLYPPIKTGIELIKTFEKIGYDSIWFEDHLMGIMPESIWTPDVFTLAKYMDNAHCHLETFTMMAVAALNTKKPILGTCVTEAFRRHPALIAQSILSIDHLSKGRTILGLGAGEQENIIPYGIKWDKPFKRLEEAIQIIKLFFDNDEKVSFKGDIFKLDDAVIGLSPIKKRKPPPIWIAAHGPKMLDLTGRVADGWIPLFPNCFNIQIYKEKLNNVLNSAKKAKRNPESITPSLFIPLIIENDHEECHKLINSPIGKLQSLVLPSKIYETFGFKHPLGKDFRGLIDFIPTRYSRDSVLDAFDKIPLEICEKIIVHGTPEDIIQELENYINVGLRHIVLFNLTFFSDLTKINTSHDCIKEVIEYFKKNY
ncbi:MAG: LLM class flavin-dependent oxidoreductase [Promethearchaeota archaeon]